MRKAMMWNHRLLNPPPPGKKVRRRRRRPGLPLIAHHEAGHAVAAFLAGIDCEGLTVVPAGRALGMHVATTEFFASGDPASEAQEQEGASAQSVEQQILGTLGGPVAECLFVGRCGWRAGSSDLADAMRLQRSLGTDQGTDAIEALWAHWLLTERLLSARRHWKAVSVIASLLLAKKSLSGRRVEQELRSLGLTKGKKGKFKMSGEQLNAWSVLQETKRAAGELVTAMVRDGRLPPSGHHKFDDGPVIIDVAWTAKPDGNTEVTEVHLAPRNSGT
jgi:hypothetical protein